MLGLPAPVDVESLARTNGSWSQVVVAGELVAVSGQVALGRHGELLGGNSLVGQALHVFAAIDAALSAAMSSRRGLLKLTIYVTDVDDLEALRMARDQWLGEHAPASTLVKVGGLVRDDLLIEVDALAVRTPGG
jgi:enamine deaminase RidA (YjgF/YER057c/UK114 family)